MDKRKKDYLLNTIFYQLIICVLLFVSIYFMKTTNSGVYDTLNDEFYKNIDNNIIINSTENKDKPETITTDTTESMETTVNKTSEATTVKNVRKIIDETPSVLSATILSNKTSVEAVPANVSVNNYKINQKMIAPVTGTITSPFGYREHPVYGEEKFHAGVDIAAKEGTPIYSCFDGIVYKAEFDQWNGNYLKIKHEGGIMTVYCHCSELKVKPGDNVKAGDIIAYIGSTGVSTGPHLHFELRINDISYNPQNALDTAINAI